MLLLPDSTILASASGAVRATAPAAASPIAMARGRRVLTSELPVDTTGANWRRSLLPLPRVRAASEATTRRPRVRFQMILKTLFMSTCEVLFRLSGSAAAGLAGLSTFFRHSRESEIRTPLPQGVEGERDRKSVV